MLSYDCGPIPGGQDIFDSSITAIGLKTGNVNGYDPRGWVVDLGTGVASNPVLDSSGYSRNNSNEHGTNPYG